MIDRDFLDGILETTQPQLLKTDDGRTFSSATVQNLPLPIEPEYPTLKLLTLDSLVDFLVKNATAGRHINVTHSVASLMGEPEGVNRRRPVFVQSAANLEQIHFGNYQSIEDFRIMLLTRFRESPDRETILRFIAKISDEHVATSEDNGISQSVTIRSGIATHSAAVVPSPLQLAPIRTFIEVEQPTGHFVFRLKQEKDRLPTAALFELPTNWQREAAIGVKKYLDGKLNGSIQVFA